MILSGLIHDSALTSVFHENAENPREGFQGNKPTYNVCPMCVCVCLAFPFATDFPPLPESAALTLSTERIIVNLHEVHDD